MKVLVAYDGSLDSKAALKYGIKRVREIPGELIALHVFPSHRFIDYGAGPRAEERARRDAFRHLDEAREFIQACGKGIKASVVFTEGQARKEILGHAKQENVDLIVVPPSLDSLLDAACCLVDVVSADEEATAAQPATLLNNPGGPVESRA